MNTTLAAKFHPNAFKTSNKMTALLAFILGEEWTEPAIAELHITSDGMVLARHSDDCGCNQFIGGVSDLVRNIAGCMEAAELTEDEIAAFDAAMTARVKDWRS